MSTPPLWSSSLVAVALPRLAVQLRRRYPDLALLECHRIPWSDRPGYTVAYEFQGTPAAIAAAGLATLADAEAALAGASIGGPTEHGDSVTITGAFDYRDEPGCVRVHTCVYDPPSDRTASGLKRTRDVERMLRRALKSPRGRGPRFADIRDATA